MNTILIVPCIPEMDQLMVILVRLLDYDVVLLRADESPVLAINEKRPVAMLIDAEHSLAADPSLILAAQRANTAVILFSCSLRPGALRTLAQSQGAGFFPMPNGPLALDATIRESRRMAGMRGVNEAERDIPRWACLAAHHQARVSWYNAIMSRVAAGTQRAGEIRKSVRASRAALAGAREAAAQASEHLREEVTRYARWLQQEEGLPAAELASRIGKLVHEGFDDATSGREANDIQKQVERWCQEIGASAA